jgi:predicted transcriptional regulator
VVADIENTKAKLRAAFNDIPMQMADGDGQLTEQFLEMLHHLCAASQPFLTWRQSRIMALYFGPPRMTQERIAEVLGVSVRTVRNDYSGALEAIAERVEM